MPYALHEAAERGQLGELVRLFVLGQPGQTADIHSRNPAGETPLYAAVRSGRIDVVILLLCNGADVNEATLGTAEGPGGETPLHLACALGNAQIVRHLLVSGANVNAKTGVSATGLGGNTPLHVAAQRGQVEITRILLANGADENATNALGQTPLALASGKGLFPVANELVAEGARVGAGTVIDQCPSQPVLEPHENRPATVGVQVPPTEAPVSSAAAQQAASGPPQTPEVKAPATNEDVEATAQVVDQKTASPVSAVPPKIEAASQETMPPPLPVKPAAQRLMDRRLDRKRPAPERIQPEAPKAATLAAAKNPQLSIRVRDRRIDPTLNWGTFHPPIPDVDMSRVRFGSLRFGDGLQGASFLGRPDRFVVKGGNYCELLYARGGFQLDFDKNRFAYLAFFIGPDPCLPEHRDLQFSAPRLHGGSLNRIHLTRQTDRATLERIFGAPDSVDADAQESVLYYTRQEVTMEFELDGRTGRLKRWNLYPKGTGAGGHA